MPSVIKKAISKTGHISGWRFLQKIGWSCFRKAPAGGLIAIFAARIGKINLTGTVRVYIAKWKYEGSRALFWNGDRLSALA